MNPDLVFQLSHKSQVPMVFAADTAELAERLVF